MLGLLPNDQPSPLCCLIKGSQFRRNQNSTSGKLKSIHDIAKCTALYSISPFRSGISITLIAFFFFGDAKISRYLTDFFVYI